MPNVFETVFDSRAFERCIFIISIAFKPIRLFLFIYIIFSDSEKKIVQKFSRYFL